ncbi:glycoside hydrolase family 2 TIM barrel-domain containing protein [Pedobacter sp. BS3]|uniref:glycoside hydrolase family 2 TIM barrel-domain containing protein n=1 Tax=Pedobacter sp. BS3 TaxID=2567937 RepID=UPI00165974C1|nr:glycoside hydrolase family 2 TIM barrel-domain containing protein [Pedobacter sp. BS3]
METLNAGWQFHRGDIKNYFLRSPATDNTQWQTINIPHTWNATDILPQHKRTPYRDIGFYKKTIRNFVKQNDQRYYLYFEGANQETDLYINNQKAGNHKGGYTAFCFDITSYLKTGDNVITIRVNSLFNADIPPLSADFTFFGGIYRDVYMITTAGLHFTLSDYASSGVYIETPAVNNTNGTVKVKSTIVNQTPVSQKFVLQTIITDQENKEISRLNKELVIAAGQQLTAEQLSNNITGIRLWSPDKPYLYRAETQLLLNNQVIDEVTNPIGFRWFKFGPDSGFQLNGKPLKLMGANRHQDYPGMGNALPDEIHYSDMKLLKDMGANFVRLAHYPQDPAVLHAADELGLLVWEEIPLVNEITISKAYNDNARNMLHEMIRQHYNHPSVILWGYMNEIYWKHRFIDSSLVNLHTQKTIELAKQLEAIARSEDKNRYTAMAMHNYPLYEKSGLSDIPMIAGWNLYHGWYYDNFEDFGKFMDAQHKLHPKRIHLISEYGAGSDPRVHTDKPVRFDFSIEGQKRFLESFIKQIQERPYIAGATVWNLIDFSSEMRVDATPRINNKGLTTVNRTPKDAYYLYQAALSKKPVLKIAETDYQQRCIQLKSGQQEAIQTIDIYTNLAKAELFLNNQSLGSKATADHKISWDVLFKQSGEYMLKIVAQGDTATYEDRLPITVNLVPSDLKTIKNMDLAINAGSHYSFRDDHSGTIWLPDQPYQPGSWGYINPDKKPKIEKIASLEDINNTDLDPLYQSMRTGMKQYKFDVADGWYEVELLCVEPLPKMRRFADSPEPPPHPGGLRIMSVMINNMPFLHDVDLIKDYGYNNPLREKIMVKASNGNGITLDFTPNAIVSGIRVRAVE